jgi:selenocysteine lyase/cysteine desulfurase
MDLQQRFGVNLVLAPEREGRIEIDDLLSAITPRTRMVAISHVEYASGYVNDIATLGRFCRERNILLLVDAIQSCGVLPVDVKAMNIDFLSADGHKWMLGPEGAGMFFCRRDLLTSVRPEVGWMNVVNAQNYGDIDFTLRTDAKRFECGSYNIPGLLAFGAALEVLEAVGMSTVTARVLGLTQRLCDGLAGKGYHVVSSRRAGEASGIVSFVGRPGSVGRNHHAVIAALEKQRICIVEREGRLRASPHFYNTPEQIDRLIAALPEGA